MRRVEKDGQVFYEVLGQLMTEAEFDEKFAPTTQEAGSSLVSFKPLKSDALAVHFTQVEKARESAKRKGVPVEFTKDGRPIFTSSRQYRNYMRAYKFRSRSYM